MNTQENTEKKGPELGVTQGWQKDRKKQSQSGSYYEESTNSKQSIDDRLSREFVRLYKSLRYKPGYEIRIDQDGFFLSRRSIPKFSSLVVGDYETISMWLRSVFGTDQVTDEAIKEHAGILFSSWGGSYE